MARLHKTLINRFNSYTQQLCCNDIVRLPGGRPATENDLKDTMQDPPSQKSLPSSGAESGILSTQKGTESIIQKKIGVGNDNQNVVSQVVDWHASFVVCNLKPNANRESGL
jgi:hypothetical protein